MSIIRLTVRTFQSVEHANMFVVMSEKVANDSNNTDLKIIHISDIFNLRITTSGTAPLVTVIIK